MLLLNLSVCYCTADLLVAHSPFVPMSFFYFSLSPPGAIGPSACLPLPHQRYFCVTEKKRGGEAEAPSARRAAVVTKNK